jgi:hypothetical protein
MKLDLITNNALKIGDINPNDEFYTPNYAIEPIVKYLKTDSNIWCPFDTKNSNFVKLLTQYGFNVSYSHIEQGGGDFFENVPDSNIDYIISNPPYSIKAEVFNRLFELNIPFAMLVGVVGIFESQTRFNMFKNNKFEIMYMNKRISYFKDYSDQKPSLNPPFSSVYICSNILPNQICFETIDKK